MTDPHSAQGISQGPSSFPTAAVTAAVMSGENSPSPAGLYPKQKLYCKYQTGGPQVLHGWEPEFRVHFIRESQISTLPHLPFWAVGPTSWQGQVAGCFPLFFFCLCCRQVSCSWHPLLTVIHEAIRESVIQAAISAPDSSFIHFLIRNPQQPSISQEGANLLSWGRERDGTSKKCIVAAGVICHKRRRSKAQSELSWGSQIPVWDMFHAHFQLISPGRNWPKGL